MPKIKIEKEIYADAAMAEQVVADLMAETGVSDVQVISDGSGSLEIAFKAADEASQAAAEDKAAGNGNSAKAVSFPKKITEEFAGASAGQALTEISSANGKLTMRVDSMEVSAQGEGNGNDYSLKASRTYGANASMYPIDNGFTRVKSGTFGCDVKIKDQESTGLLVTIGENNRGQAISIFGSNTLGTLQLQSTLGSFAFEDTGIPFSLDTFYSVELKYDPSGFSVKINNVEVYSSEEPQYLGLREVGYQTRNLGTYLDKIKCWVTEGE